MFLFFFLFVIIFAFIFKHFDCNYGAMHVPLDWLFGTYAGCKEEVFVFVFVFSIGKIEYIFFCMLSFFFIVSIQGV